MTAHKERPILFSGPMVRALLDGSKTQTRRVLKPWVPRLHHAAVPADVEYLLDFTCYRATCPYGQPGDRLRVKEAAWMWCERLPNGKTKTGRQKWLYVPMREAPIHYAADHAKKPSIEVVSPETGNEWGWRLKIGRFLPAWASRITLEITGVRVERLQAISNEDARAEGVMPDYADQCASLGHPYNALPLFRQLWASINGPGSWDANPWLWAISFRRVEA